MDSLFTAFRGTMPVNPEIRFFVKGGEVQCSHFYWIEDAIQNPSIDNWKEVLEATKKKSSIDEYSLLNNYARTISEKLLNDGDVEQWSVDFCRDAFGEWQLIDMAIGKNSWHPKDCKFNETEHQEE